MSDTFAPDGIDSPFVTSVKEIGEDFLVIPIKYLKKQLADDEKALSDVDNNVPKDKDRAQLDGVNEVMKIMNDIGGDSNKGNLLELKARLSARGSRSTK